MDSCYRVKNEKVVRRSPCLDNRPPSEIMLRMETPQPLLQAPPIPLPHLPRHQRAVVFHIAISHLHPPRPPLLQQYPQHPVANHPDPLVHQVWKSRLLKDCHVSITFILLYELSTIDLFRCFVQVLLFQECLFLFLARTMRSRTRQGKSNQDSDTQSLGK